jgi:hypothetical protein
MGTRLLAITVALGVALSASAVLAQCGCGVPAAAPTYSMYGAPAVSYYAPAPYATYYSAPYVSYYSPYATYYSPYVSYYGWPGYGVYARPRYAYRPVVVW